MIIDYVAKFFLAFSNDIILVPLIIIGFISLSNSLYGQALITLLFTMILNKILKEYFAIPLNPALKIEGLAFPSGHMQSSIAFYGWLILFSNNMIRIILAILLLGIGFSLIYMGYHNISDVTASICFGILTILIFYNLCKFEPIDKHPYILGWIILPFTLILMFYSIFIKAITYNWLAFHVLTGFTLSWTIFNHSLNYPLKRLEKISSILLSFAVISAVYYYLPTFKILLPNYLQLEWIIVGFTIPLSIKISKHLSQIKHG